MLLVTWRHDIFHVNNPSPNVFTTETRSLLIVVRVRPRSWYRIPFLLTLVCAPLPQNRPCVQCMCSGRRGISSYPVCRGVTPLIIRFLLRLDAQGAHQNRPSTFYSLQSLFHVCLHYREKICRGVSAVSVALSSFRDGTMPSEATPFFCLDFVRILLDEVNH